MMNHSSQTEHFITEHIFHTDEYSAYNTYVYHHSLVQGYHEPVRQHSWCYCAAKDSLHNSFLQTKNLSCKNLQTSTYKSQCLILRSRQKPSVQQ